MENVINKNHRLNKKKVKKDTAEKIFWAILILPAVAIVALFILVPIVDSVIKSFTNYTLVNIIKDIPVKWNNFENYKILLERGVLGNAVGNTLIFVLGEVVCSFVIGLALALLLNANIKGARFFRSIMMTPWVVPTVISALVWNWIFQPQYGLFRYLVNFITGGQVSDFAILNNKSTALLGVGIAALWKQIPLMTLLLLAGLQNVPEDIMEAAKIDGASGATRLVKITIPYMKSVIKVAVSMSIIEN
ncbi:MAG: sugar ABC transporter permease, partial [Clostridia bacterium]